MSTPVIPLAIARASLLLFFHLLQILVDKSLFVTPRVNSVNNSIIELLQACLCNPLILNGLEFVSVLAAQFYCHEVASAVEGWGWLSNDECVVTVINGRSKERCSFDRFEQRR